MAGFPGLLFLLLGDTVEDALITESIHYYRKLFHMTEVSVRQAQFAPGEPVMLWQEIPVELQTGRARWESEDAVVHSVDGDKVVVKRSYQFNTFAPTTEGKFMRILPEGCVLPAGAKFHPLELRKNPFMSEDVTNPSLLRKFFSLFR